MNATLFDGGKVHRLLGVVARCGVGKRRQCREWQMELGDVTCLRCTKAKPIEQQSNKGAKVLTMNEQG
jgi:hypothetical protein